MNSVLRTVDLSTQLLAPVLVGFIMTSAGMVVGGAVIAAWNVTSLLFEYGLLHYIYYRVPALQKPKQTHLVSICQWPFLFQLLFADFFGSIFKALFFRTRIGCIAAC